MNEAHIKKVISNALQLKEETISDIYRTSGGLTNKSYFATVNGEKMVIRIPGYGTEELVNRKEEKDNLIYATKLGINPPLLYFNADSGLKITRQIEGASPITPALVREGNMMKQIIHLFKCLHTAETPMKNEFKLFNLMRHYESLVKDVNDVIVEKLAELKEDIVNLQKIYESFHIKQVPCHIDAACTNLIKGKDGNIYLIDWEYSGMFDPLWDISTLFLSLELEKDEQLFFLMQYLERKPDEDGLQCILMHIMFQDYLWCLWSFFKEAKGDDVGNDAVKRFERSTKNVILYKETFENEIVV